jgi:hypothetical protein
MYKPFFPKEALPKVRKIALDCLLLVLITTLGINYYADYHLYMDIDIGDEATYMSYFLGPKLSAQSAVKSPIYAGFYKALSYFMPDRVALYYGTKRVLMLLPSLAGYILLRRAKVVAGLSFALSVLGMFSYLNATATPHINHLFAGFFALGTLACLHTNWTIFLIRLAILFSITIFLRPEAVLPAVAAFVAAWGWFFWLNHKKRKRLAFPKLVPYSLLFIAILIWATIEMLSNKKQDIAFLQHYAINKVSNGLATGNPWLFYREINKADFPHAQTLVAAIKENPRAIARHIYFNCKSIVQDVLFIPGDVFAGGAFLAIPIGVRNTLGWVVVLGFLFWRSGKLNTASHTRTLWQILLAMAIAALPFLMAVIIIYPRPHYLLPLVWLFVWTLGIMASPLFSNLGGGVAAILIVALFLVFRPHLGHRFSNSIPDKPFLATLTVLRDNHITKGGLISVLHYSAYLGPDIKEVHGGTGRRTTLRKHFRKIDLRAIVVDDVTYRRVAVDTAWAALLANPEAFGFTPIQPTDHANVVLIKK